MPGIDMLPQELLVEIVKHLSHADRMTCSTTSQRFAEALTYAHLLKDIWFTVYGDEMQEASPVLLESRRRYQNLRLFRVRLYEFDLEFWSKAGKILRRLALDRCLWTPEVLYEIFRECSGLEYLSIDCNFVRRITLANPQAREDYLENARASLSNVRHLHLNTASVDVLGQVLGLIPNVSSISLQVSGEEFSWGNLIHRTLTDPKIVTELDLLKTHPSDSELNSIMQAFSEGLHELRLNSSRLSNGAGAAISQCSKLRRLSLQGFFALENTHMATILRSNPCLESLDLLYCTLLADDGVSPILELRKLRRLTIHCCRAITNEFYSRLGELLTLEYVYLSFKLLNSKTIESIACLKNLEGLHLESHIQSPESFRMICMNLENLQTLNLGDCRDLSDADGLMLSRLRRLRTLEFKNAPQFKDLAIDGGIGGSEMESLTVEDSLLTDSGLLSLVGRQGRLKDISLNGCDRITDQGLIALLPRKPLLRKVVLNFSSSIGDEFLEALADRCPRLRYVEIRGCATSDCAMRSFRGRRRTVHACLKQRRYRPLSPAPQGAPVTN